MANSNGIIILLSIAAFMVVNCAGEVKVRLVAPGDSVIHEVKFNGDEKLRDILKSGCRMGNTDCEYTPMVVVDEAGESMDLDLTLTQAGISDGYIVRVSPMNYEEARIRVEMPGNENLFDLVYDGSKTVRKIAQESCELGVFNCDHVPVKVVDTYAKSLSMDETLSKAGVPKGSLLRVLVFN